MATGLENLWIYKLAEDLEIEVYNITKDFPRHEFYKSVDQIRRSSASVANNMAESYHRSTTKDRVRILRIALGEAEETKRNLHKSSRKGFIEDDKSASICERYTVLMKGTNAYIRFLEVGKNNNLN